MAIYVTEQYDGGLLPDMIVLTICDYFGEPFWHHVELLSRQPMFPPTTFPPRVDILDAFRFFLKHYAYYSIAWKTVPT